jgi:hypothetical protein
VLLRAERRLREGVSSTVFKAKLLFNQPDGYVFVVVDRNEVAHLGNDSDLGSAPGFGNSCSRIAASLALINFVLSSSIIARPLVSEN